MLSLRLFAIVAALPLHGQCRDTADGRKVLADAATTTTGASASSQTTKTSDCKAAEDILDDFTETRFASSLGSCALVGSGGALKGKGMGGVIDSHDTVIRVNRVPSHSYFPDLGSKTDLFFSNSATDTYPGGQIGAWITQMREGDPVGLKLWCEFRHKIRYPSNCPFESIIVARSTKYGIDRVGERIDMPFRIRQFMQPPFPVAHPSLPLETFYWNAAPMEGYYTSGGLKAFFATAPRCDTITLYGFAGSGNIDNHTIDSVHNFGVEHAWLHRMVSGDLREEDFKVTGVENWLWQNGLNKSVLDKLPSFTESLRARLQCMADRGKIKIDGWSPPERTGNGKGGVEAIRGGAQVLAEFHSPSDQWLRGLRTPADAPASRALLWGGLGVMLVASALAVTVRSNLRRRRAGIAGISQEDAEGSAGLLF